MSEDAVITHSNAPEKAKGKGSIVVGALLVAMSGAAGFGFAKFYLVDVLTAQMAMEAPAVSSDAKAAPSTDEAKAKKADADDGKEMSADYEGGGELLALDPIVTNIADPADVWVRAEMSIEISEELPEGMKQQLQADLLAFLRTLRLQNLETPSGYQHLLQDLEDIIAFKSQNAARKILVSTFILE